MPPHLSDSLAIYLILQLHFLLHPSAKDPPAPQSPLCLSGAASSKSMPKLLSLTGEKQITSWHVSGITQAFKAPGNPPPCRGSAHWGSPHCACTSSWKHSCLCHPRTQPDPPSTPHPPPLNTLSPPSKHGLHSLPVYTLPREDSFLLQSGFCPIARLSPGPPAASLQFSP